MSSAPLFADPNPGLSRANPLSTVLRSVKSESGVNQIRGTDTKGATSYGIPSHVTNIGVSTAQASSGATSTLRVTFHRDPSDKSYSETAIWVKGYQGNNNPVKVGSSNESPATVVLNNTGEPVSVIAQATGNGGQAPLDSAPTTGVRLPQSTVSGYGTSTTIGYTPASPPPTPTAQYMLGPGILNLNEAQPIDDNQAFSSTPNVVRVCSFYLAANVGALFLDGSFTCNLGPGSHFAMGVYDTTGKQLWSSGSLAVGNVSNTAISFPIPQLSLTGGQTYYLAWTSADSGNTTTWGTNTISNITWHSGTSNGNVVNQGTVLVGTAANAASAGPVMPATLGAISIPTVSFGVPLVLFR